MRAPAPTPQARKSRLLSESPFEITRLAVDFACGLAARAVLTPGSAGCAPEPTLPWDKRPPPPGFRGWLLCCSPSKIPSSGIILPVAPSPSSLFPRKTVPPLVISKLALESKTESKVSEATPQMCRWPKHSQEFVGLINDGRRCCWLLATLFRKTSRIIL